MDAYRIQDVVAQASIGMVQGKPIRVDDGRGVEVGIVYGAVWITQHHDANDICLTAGDRFRIGRDGVTVIDALAPSLVTLTPPAAQHSALRVSMLGGDAGPVPLFGSASRPASTRFDAWPDRFWVRLFVPAARPTTAAL